MQWMFLVSADLEFRTHARVLQVLDQQRVPIHSFAVSNDEWATIHALLELDPEKVYRVRELLRRIPAVHRVECFAPSEGICRTVALFEVSCDSLTQLPVLQAAAALDLAVVSVDSCAVVVEAIGSFSEIAGFERVYSQHGALTTVARTTLGIARTGDQHG
jgi:acetolactate synthase small subunit